MVLQVPSLRTKGWVPTLEPSESAGPGWWPHRGRSPLNRGQGSHAWPPPTLLRCKTQEATSFSATWPACPWGCVGFPSVLERLRGQNPACFPAAMENGSPRSDPLVLEDECKGVTELPPGPLEPSGGVTQSPPGTRGGMLSGWLWGSNMGERAQLYPSPSVLLSSGPGLSPS